MPTGRQERLLHSGQQHGGLKAGDLSRLGRVDVLQLGLCGRLIPAFEHDIAVGDLASSAQYAAARPGVLLPESGDGKG